MDPACNVCGTRLGVPIYESAENGSITTMNKLIPGRTRVFFCEACGHLQTSELPNLAEYYAHEYEVNLGSEEDDQLYKLIDGRPVYRADHQAAVLQSKVAFFPGCRVLDYGCAKAPTLRKTVAANMGIEPFLFDVTDKYIPFWKRFPKPPQWSIHQPDPAWHGTMDVVLSFYALEHVSDLDAAICNVKALLRKGGTFYFLVPNVYANVADFIVADHINHFSRSSLHGLLERHEFDSIEIDDTAHDAAFVVKARLASDPGAPRSAVSSALDKSRAAVSDMARYWQSVAGRIRHFEDSIRPAGVVAIYGAGFYGNFIASVLRQFDQVRCFVDQNRFLQGNAINGRPILAPESLPDDVTHVFVGLNPRIAESTIGSLKCWNGRQLEFFFL